MKAVILGAGQVGYHIAKYLSQEEGWSVSVVDHTVDVLDKISSRLDVQPILGFASHPHVLEKAGVQHSDLLIALTASDEVNAIACQVTAHLALHPPFKIARIRHQDYLNTSFFSGHSSLSNIDVIISPEIEVANTIYEGNKIRGALSIFSATESLTLVSVRCTPMANLCDTPLNFLHTVLPYLEWVILCIHRKDRVFSPLPNDTITHGDEVYFLAHSKDIQAIMDAFGHMQTTDQSIILIGGGNIGRTLAGLIEKKSPEVEVTLIEKNNIQCALAHAVLSKTVIIRGDGLDFEILKEAGLVHSNLLITLTDDDKTNVLAALVAKSETIRTICLLSDSAYEPLVTSLGIDTIINPKALTINSILKHIAKKHFDWIQNLGETDFILVGAQVTETSPVIGLTASDLTVEDAVYIAALIHHGHIIFSPTLTIIGVKDTLIILCHKLLLPKIEKLFLRHS